MTCRLHPWALLAGLSVFAADLPCQQDAVRVAVFEPAPLPRTRIVTAAVPFAMGVLPLGPATDRAPFVAVTVTDAAGERPAPAVVQARWRDGSVCLLHVHVRVTTVASGRSELRVQPQRDAEGRAVPCTVGPHRPLVTEPLPLCTELRDPWRRAFTARLEPDPTAGPGGVLVDSGLVRTRRFRSLHRGDARADEAAGKPLLGLRAYLTTFDGERRAELVLVLDNQDLPTGPLGPVRFRQFSLHTETDALRFLPAYASENLVPPPGPRAGGGFVQALLADNDAHYLGGETGKAFLVHLFEDDASVTEAERAAAQYAERPVVAFADLDHVRRTRAFGAHGGPAPGSDEDAAHFDQAMAEELLAAWRRSARFGPYGGFGDPEYAAAGGSPRFGDSALHNVLRWQHPALLHAAMGMVLQQTLRPTAGPPAEPQDMAAFRQGLGPVARAAPHGITGLDYEHASVLLLYDAWWLTGDALARDELARQGRALRAILGALPFQTSRGEGLALTTGVLVARATGDAELLQWLHQRWRETLRPALEKAPKHIAIAQPPYADVLDGKEPFDAPWQMAALVQGLAALHVATGDPDLIAAIQRLADALAGPCWVEDRGPKTFVSAVDSKRHAMAADPETFRGTARMTIGAFVRASELVADAAAVARYRERIEFLMKSEVPVDAAPAVHRRAAANPWLQLVLDRGWEVR